MGRKRLRYIGVVDFSYRHGGAVVCRGWLSLEWRQCQNHGTLLADETAKLHVRLYGDL